MFNYYRHIKTKRCITIKSKCLANNEEENIEPLEETEKSNPSDSSPDSRSAIINDNEASSSIKKRHDSLASSIGQSIKKRKRIV